MKLLIFGATGLAGGWAARAAIKHGHEVTLHVRNKEKVPEDIAKSDKVKNILEGDLLDEPSLSAAVEGQDAILSTVGPSKVFTNFNNLFPDFARLLMKLMRQHHVRRILAMSTVSYYDERDSFSLMRTLVYCMVFAFARGAQRDLMNMTEVFKNEGSDLDWTVFRIGTLKNSPAVGDRVAKVGWVGDGKSTSFLERGEWANWMMAEVERDEPRYVHELPLIYTP